MSTGAAGLRARRRERRRHPRQCILPQPNERTGTERVRNGGGIPVSASSCSRSFTAAGGGRGVLRRSSVSASSCSRSFYRESTKTGQTRTLSREPLLRTPWSRPLSIPRPPARTRKTPPPTPRFAGPAPTASTWIPDAFGQYPAGSRSEDDPCLGLRRQPTGGACGSSMNTASVRHSQYPCGGSGGIFLSFHDSGARELPLRVLPPGAGARK